MIKTFQLLIDEELQLHGDPSLALGAATKQYVDNAGIVSSSYSDPGYVQFGNGLIIQFGSTPVLTQNATHAQILPITFPNTGISLIACPRVANGTQNSQTCSGIIESTSDIRLLNTATVPIAFGIYWIVLGV